MKKKDKTTCKKCGQSLPVEPPPRVKRFPSVLRGTVILPGVKNAEQPVKFVKKCSFDGWPWPSDFGLYTNESDIVFEPVKKDCVIGDKVIVNVQGMFYLVPMHMNCTVMGPGDTLNFAKEALTLQADEDVKT